MGAIQIRVDNLLVRELDRIRSELKIKMGGVIDFSKPQASLVAASILKGRKEIKLIKINKKNYKIMI